MLKDLIFPNLEPESSGATPSAPGDSFSALVSGIADARFVEIGGDDVDISDFPAMRTALRLSGANELECEPENDSTADGSELLPVSEAFASDDDAEFYDTTDSTTKIDKPHEIEEPVPAIFAGIGRTDWSVPESRALPPGIELLDIPEQYRALFAQAAAEETTAANDEETDEPQQPEESCEEEEDSVNELDLLDLIDDIEFSDLEPEHVSPVIIDPDSRDPYNVEFNSRVEEKEPDEIAMSPKFIFES